MSEPLDWSSFHFPPPPPRRWNDGATSGLAQAPDWAAPPRLIKTWHLDTGRFLIIHPVLRKKIDLTRIITKRRLSQVAQTIRAQSSDHDVASLWRTLDDACRYAFGLSLPEMLSSGPTDWVWPVTSSEQSDGLDASDDHSNDQVKFSNSAEDHSDD